MWRSNVWERKAFKVVQNQSFAAGRQSLGCNDHAADIIRHIYYKSFFVRILYFSVKSSLYVVCCVSRNSVRPAVTVSHVSREKNTEWGKESERVARACVRVSWIYFPNCRSGLHSARPPAVLCVTRYQTKFGYPTNGSFFGESFFSSSKNWLCNCCGEPATDSLLVIGCARGRARITKSYFLWYTIRYVTCRRSRPLLLKSNICVNFTAFRSVVCSTPDLA